MWSYVLRRLYVVNGPSLLPWLCEDNDILDDHLAQPKIKLNDSGISINLHEDAFVFVHWFFRKKTWQLGFRQRHIDQRFEYREYLGCIYIDVNYII